MFQKYLNATHRSVKGVTCLDTGKPGFTTGVLAIVHGNEPVGLHVFQKVEEYFTKHLHQLQGKVLLIAVNREGYKKHLLAQNTSIGRLVDVNMNRLYGKKYEESLYEHKRYQQLKKILNEIDIALDLHSTSQPSSPMVICHDDARKQAKKFLLGDYFIVDDFFRTGALLGHIVKEGKPAFGIECGMHISQAGIELGFQNVMRAIHYVHGDIPQNRENMTDNIYRFYEEIKPHSSQFAFSKNYSAFDQVGIDELYASDGKRKYINTSKKRYIGFISETINIGDGVGYLLEKIFSTTSHGKNTSS